MAPHATRTMKRLVASWPYSAGSVASLAPSESHGEVDDRQYEKGDNEES